MNIQNRNNFFKNPRTNWRYILIVIILAFFVGGGILGYQWWVVKEEIKTPKIKISEKITEEEAEVTEVEPEVMVPEEKELEEGRLKDSISNVEIIARENQLDKNKTDIFIKDLNTDKEEFYITLSGIDRDYFNAEFRNEHLYIIKNWIVWGRICSELWKYSSPNDEGNILFAPTTKIDIDDLPFMVSPDESFVVVIYPKIEEEELGLPVYDYLLFINLETKEQKEFSSKELTTNDIISYQEKMYEITNVSLVPELEKWSNNSEDLWGVTYAITSADPPMPSYVSLFKINTNDWTVEKFIIPSTTKLFNYVSPETLNLEREAILLETASEDGGLSLYFYDLRSKEKKLIVSYSKEVFYKYFKWFFQYRYYSPDSGSRELMPKWINNNTISYLDFETREEIIKKIE